MAASQSPAGVMVTINETTAINVNHVAWFVLGESKDAPVTLYMTCAGPKGENWIIVRDPAAKTRLTQLLFGQ